MPDSDTYPQQRRGRLMPASHIAVVYSRRRARDGFARTWWVECIRCSTTPGPFPPGFARFVAVDMSTFDP